MTTEFYFLIGFVIVILIILVVFLVYNQDKKEEQLPIISKCVSKPEVKRECDVNHQWVVDVRKILKDEKGSPFDITWTYKEKPYEVSMWETAWPYHCMMDSENREYKGKTLDEILLEDSNVSIRAILDINYPIGSDCMGVMGNVSYFVIQYNEQDYLVLLSPKDVSKSIFRTYWEKM